MSCVKFAFMLSILVLPLSAPACVAGGAEDRDDLDKVPLFDTRLQDFFWQYDNTGLRLAQLRFYEVPTDTN